MPISGFENVPLDRDNMPHDMKAPLSKRSYDTMLTLTANDDQSDVRHDSLIHRSNMSTHLRGDVDPEAATLTLIAYCFMTGFMCVSFSGLCYVYSPLVNSDSVTFSAAYVWCGFQTGNGTQVIQNDFKIKKTCSTIFLTVSHRPRPSLRRTPRAQRPNFPQPRPTRPHLPPFLHLRSLLGPHRR